MSSVRPKVMTVVGTRPEIIRLSETIKLLDRRTEHVLVHTGQNYDYELNEIFFQDLGLRQPNHFLNADTSSLGTAMGTILSGIEQVLQHEEPDAFLVLGDTNSCISAVMAKRLQIPVFHMEAGNRCYDERVPEETNRRLVDHVSDFNLVYTEHARRNLLREGLHPSRIHLTGSPMREVIDANISAIQNSKVLTRENLEPGKYFLASIHRQETVDDPTIFAPVVNALTQISREYSRPVILSTHPRTRRKIEALGATESDGILMQKPFGFHDYNKLQMNACLVLSDSGTIAEEAYILGFNAITLRNNIERPEALDAGSIIKSGTSTDVILQLVKEQMAAIPITSGIHEYDIDNTSIRVVNQILSHYHQHRSRWTA